MRRFGARHALWSTLRQRLFPPALRIAEPVWPADLAAALEGLARESAPGPEAEHDQAVAEPAQASAPPHDDRALDEHVVVEIATRLYRAARALRASDPQLPRALRHVDGAAAALAEAGVELIDLTGQPYHTGLVGIDPIAFEDTVGIDRETVLETPRPGVYIDGRCVQVSKVVVGVPVPGGSSKPAQPADEEKKT